MNSFNEFSSNEKNIDNLIKKLAINKYRYKDYSFLNALKRAIYIDIDRSNKSQEIYEDIKNKKCKKKYFNVDYYFFNLLKINFPKN